MKPAPVSKERRHQMDFMMAVWGIEARFIWSVMSGPGKINWRGVGKNNLAKYYGSAKVNEKGAVFPSLGKIDLKGLAEKARALQTESREKALKRRRG